MPEHAFERFRRLRGHTTQASTTSAVAEEMISIEDDVLVDDDAPVEVASVDVEVSTAAPTEQPPIAEPPGTLFHMWSTVFHCELWIMETDAQAQTQRAAGRVAYSAREVRVLQALKQRVPEGFGDGWLQAIHGYRALFDATIETPAAADAPPTNGTRRAPQRPTKPRDPRLGPIVPPCATCGEWRYWHNHVRDTYECWTCVPPAPLQGCAPRPDDAPPSGGTGWLMEEFRPEEEITV